jgi:glutamate racemase
MTAKQVLIFDSGVGGLSVFQKVVKQVPNINYFYLFDNANFPYGELEDDFLIDTLINLLRSFIDHTKIDLIIIACNSASTVALSSLRQSFSIPIVGVVPAIKPAALATKNNVIGLLATPATINRDYTTQLINRFAADKQVLKIGSTQLVKLAEAKLAGQVIQKSDIEAVLAPWLSLVKRPDTLVLGCTHFPLLKEEIAVCFDHQIQLVDSGKAIAQRVQQLLSENNVNPEINQHHAYYTKAYKAAEKQSLQALQQSFIGYGFSSLNYYP